MRKNSVGKLIEVNKLFNEADGLHVIKHENFVIVTFYDKEGDIETAILSHREYELVRIDFYSETLHEIVDLIVDNKQKMKVTISQEVENFPVLIEFEHSEYFCNIDEYKFILEEVSQDI